MADLKRELKNYLEMNDLTAACACVLRDRKAMSPLIRLAYDKETPVGWRAIVTVGLAARELASSGHDFLRETCRKLLWSLTDESGGIGWSAPELLGEIVSADPHRFADLLPLIAQVYDIEEDVFKAGVLYALCRIAENAPELVAPYQKIVMMAIHDRDPLVRIRGIELIGLLWHWAKSSGVWSPEYCERIRLSLGRLTKDKGEAWIYIDNDFTSFQIGEEAEKTLLT